VAEGATVHVAIVDARAAQGLLKGRKRVESRFARRRRLPYGRISVGDLVYFKLSGGTIIGHSTALRVHQFDQLTPGAIDRLRCRFNRRIHAPASYWQARRHCRYGVLIWLSGFTARLTALAVPRQYGSGWVLLSAAGR